jgi:hypothetical protein
MTDFFKTYPIEDATRADAVSYISLLLSVASLDGADADEIKAIELLISNNGWDPQILEEARSNDQISIESMNLSKDLIDVMGPYFVRDLVSIAHVSNGFSSEEDAYIDSIREKMGISTESYHHIKKSVSAHFELIENWSLVISR